MKFGVSRLIVLASEGSPFQFAKLISRAARALALATRFHHHRQVRPPIDWKVGCPCIDRDLRPTLPGRVSKPPFALMENPFFNARSFRIINYFVNRGNELARERWRWTFRWTVTRPFRERAFYRRNKNGQVVEELCQVPRRRVTRALTDV